MQLWLQWVWIPNPNLISIFSPKSLRVLERSELGNSELGWGFQQNLESLKNIVRSRMRINTRNWCRMQQLQHQTSARVCVASDLDACESGELWAGPMSCSGPVQCQGASQGHEWSPGPELWMSVFDDCRHSTEARIKSGHRQWTRQ